MRPKFCENFENRDFHGLGYVESPLWLRNLRFRCAAHNVLKITIWLVDTVANQSAEAIPRQRQLRLPSARGRWRDGIELPAGFGFA